MQEHPSPAFQCPSPPHGHERRQSPRYPIRLEASLERADTPGKLACLVLNFCREGMFLKLSPTSSKPTAGETVTVVLSPDRESTHRLPARLVRITDLGIGVKFDRPLPVPLLESLLALADDPTKQTRYPNAAQLLQFTLATGKEALHTTLGNFLPQLEQRLFEAAGAATSNTEQTALLDAVHLLQQHRAQLAPELEHSLEDKARAYFARPEAENKDRRGVSSPSLSLINQNDFEDWLNMTETAARTEAAYQDKLRPLKHVFAQASCLGNDSVSPPLFPTALCDCLRLALNRIGIENSAARKVAYQAFTDALQPDFRKILARFEQVFQIDLSHPVFFRQRPPAHASTPPPAGEPDSKPPPTKPEPTPNAGRQRTIPARPGIFHSLRLLAQANHLASSPVDLRPLADLVPAITGPTDRWHSDEIVEKLMETAKASGRMSPQQDLQTRTQLQTTCQLIDALAAESLPAKTPGTPDLVAQLRLPLLRLGLLEPELLESESGPAAGLVNQLGTAGALAGQNPALGKTLAQFVQSLTAELLDPNQEVQATLQQADARLDRLLTPVLRKRQRFHQRLLDNYEGRQKIAESQLAVLEALQERLSGQPVPDPLIALLEAGWYHLLVLTHLRHGRESRAWQRQIETLAQLLSWLTADPEIRLPEPEVGALISQVDSDLGAVCSDVIKHRQLIRDLSACLLGPAQGQKRGTTTKSPIDFSQFVDPQLVAKPTGISGSVEALTIGDWIRVRRDDQNIPYKLVWIGTTPPLYLFVDAAGSDRLELTPRQLSTLFQNHTAAPIANLDLPLMDRAADRVLHELYAKVHPKPGDPANPCLDRKEFIHHLKQALIQTGRPDTQHTLIQLELDTLHVIASIGGESCETTFLRHFIELIRARLPASSRLARLRESTFVILLSDHSLEDAFRIARSLRLHLGRNRFRWQDQDYSLDAHIGLVPFSWGNHPEQILLNANVTCQQARNAGRNQIKIYKEKDREILQEKNLLRWAGQINKLFDEERLFLRCQQIAPLCAHSTGHYEILVGGRDNQGGVLLPDEFIPAIEHFKRSPDLDWWVVEKTLRWMREHTGELQRIGGFSINLSGHSVLDKTFKTTLEQLLQRHQDLIPRLTFEITETAAVNSFKQASRFIRNFKRLGCKFSLDDFGTGYASYAYLKHLDFDYLKIDGSFIRDILTSPADEEIVKSINQIAHSLGLKTIAEYAETEAILARLKALGLDYAQGYGIARPIPLQDLRPDG